MPFTPLTRADRLRPRPPIAALSALLVAGFIAIGNAGAAGEDHSGHRMEVGRSRAGCDRSLQAVRLPAVAVQRQDGGRLSFATEADVDKPVLLNFIYTTCTAICPPMTQAFAQVQTHLGGDRDKVRMISVSIDPEHDTVGRLRDYAARFKAGSQWSFYTGSNESSIAIQRAFNVYRVDKMSHTPVTFLRAPRSSEWVRLDGFIGPDDVARELRSMLPKG